MTLEGGEKIAGPLAHDEGGLSEEKSVERSISLPGTFHREMNNVRNMYYVRTCKQKEKRK